MIRFITPFLLLFIAVNVMAQPSQTIRGTIVDHASDAPLSFAAIVLLHTNPLKGSTSDNVGNFNIKDVSVGRYDIQVTFMGYEPTVVREVMVVSGKQTFLRIKLKESIASLNEVVIKSGVNKQQPLNAMATVSARMISVEESKRYAGGFDDPARLASSFAGVTSNTGENGIIVRGNAPKFAQWRMEGVEIPNPNHFGNLQSFGGGLFTALSTQMLANSDFLTGAFPAEYNNALSGVFDIAMRNGNDQKHEHTLQAGLIGMDASSEGPFKKGGKSSYLFNYRYSTLSLLAPVLPEGANTIKFQDLSFKLNFPTRKTGTFSVWGIGLTDGASSKAKQDSSKWLYYDDRNENQINQYMGAVGMSHKYQFKNNAYLKTTFAITTNQTNWNTQRLDENLNLQPQSKIENTSRDFIFSTVYTKKVSARHLKRTGIMIRGMAYDIQLNKSLAAGSAPQEIVNANGFGTLTSSFSSSTINLSNSLILNLGINSQVFSINNQYTIEPRVGFRKQINQKHAVGIAYGLHSRLEGLNYYFNNSLSSGDKAVNKNLDFTKSNHFVLSYDWNVSDVIHFKLEPYFQYLYDVPVIAGSSYSFLNLKDDLFFAEKLENTGSGRTYGVDFTLEKYISNGYYYLITGSVFNSDYKGGDGIWRNTRYNRNFVVNLLMGKEWKVGSNKQNMISLNSRLTYQGGNRYSPINQIESINEKSVVYDETRAFTIQSPATLNVHFTASYKINKKNSSREIAFKILNMTGQPDFNGHKYNMVDQKVDQNLSSTILPNLTYKIEF